LERVRAMRWGWPAAAAIGAGVMSFFVAYVCVTIGTDQLVAYNPGRNPDGSSDLANFLTYGGLIGLKNWIELLLNVSPWMDATLYAGILLTPLLICGAFVADRRRVHLVLLAGTLLLFTLGTVVAVVAFYTWPGMQYFRHIGLVSPLVKVLFCFVAGIGFEWLFEPHGWRHSRAFTAAALVSVVMLVGGGLAGLALAGSENLTRSYINELAIPGTDRPPHSYDQRIVVERLRSSAGLAFAGAFIVGLIPSLLRRETIHRHPLARRALLSGVLVFVAADLYAFKFAYLFDRSDVVPPTSRAVVRETAMPFPTRREPDLLHALATNPRLQTTVEFSPMLSRRLQGRPSLGAQYWSNNAFWFTDEAGSTFRTDSWLKPLDELMRMYSGVPIDDRATLPRGFDVDSLRFPMDHPAAPKVSGVSEDKIRFFVRAYGVAAPEDLVPLMSDRSYMGDVLFIQSVDAGGTAAALPWTDGERLSADDSLQLHYQVQRFDANNLVVDVVNPDASSIWMSYADVWHPSWHATVNGRPTPVYRANMAYKAVLLESGRNVVHFRFGSTLFTRLSTVLSANALFWLSVLGWMVSRFFREPASIEPAADPAGRPFVVQLFGT
jgi:hypothetical protein